MGDQELGFSPPPRDGVSSASGEEFKPKSDESSDESEEESEEVEDNGETRRVQPKKSKNGKFKPSRKDVTAARTTVPTAGTLLPTTITPAGKTTGKDKSTR